MIKVYQFDQNSPQYIKTYHSYRKLSIWWKFIDDQCLKKILVLIRIYNGYKNLSMWWKVNYIDEKSPIQWKVVAVFKIHRFDENSILEINMIQGD